MDTSVRERETPLFLCFAEHMSEISAMCNSFILFSYLKNTEGGRTIVMWPWLAMCGAALVYMRFFVKKERTVEQLAACGAVIYGIIAAVMCAFFIRADTVVTWLFALLFMALSVFRAVHINIVGVSPRVFTLCCELCAVGLVFLMFVEAGTPFELPAYYLAFDIGLLGLDFAALVVLRVSADSESTAVSKSAGIFFLAGGAAVAALAAAGFALFLSADIAHLMQGLLSRIIYLGGAAFGALTRFLDFIVSLLPEPERGQMDLPPMQEAYSGTGEEYYANADPAVAAIIFSVIAAALALFLIYAAFKLRKIRLSRHTASRAYRRPAAVIKSESALKKLGELLRQKAQAVMFLIRSVIMRNTPQGVFAALERRGRSKGRARRTGESQRAYIARLSQYMEPEAKADMSRLADELDRLFYSGGTSGETALTRHELRRIRRAACGISAAK